MLLLFLSLTKRPAVPRLAVYISMITLAILAGPSACKPPQEAGEAESYVENGEVWAWGSVQLNGIDTPASLKVERVEAAADSGEDDTGEGSESDQSVDRRQSTYRLYGAIEARTGGRGLRDLAYVDHHPSKGKLLAYAYQIDWREDASRPGRMQIYAVLKKAGRSKQGQRKVFLGSADFGADAKVATLLLAQGVQLSHIAYGVYAGQWALHYAKVKHIVVNPYNGQCPRVSQIPGQAPNQNPSQFKTCRPIPSQVDLCEGKPTKAGCRPKLPDLPGQAPSGSRPPVSKPRTDGLKVVTGETRVFTMEAGEKQAKVIFVSNATDADAEQNREQCGSHFFAVARTVGGQINGACVLKAAPSEPVEGKLACAISVSFDNPQTYMDRVCNVTASFKGLAEPQIVQILKK